MYRTHTVITGLAGGPYYSQMHFKSNSGTDDTSGANAAIAAVGNFWGAYGSYIGSTAVITVGGTVDSVDEASGNIQSQLPGTNVVKNPIGSGDLLPMQIQGLVHWTTGRWLNGRQLTGRTFLPGMLESINTGALPTAALATATATAKTALVDTPTAVDFVIWHRPLYVRNTSGERVLSRAGSYAEVVNGTLNTKWSNLRSRRD